jgi:hypothetical protein
VENREEEKGRKIREDGEIFREGKKRRGDGEVFIVELGVQASGWMIPSSGTSHFPIETMRCLVV